jgi:chaperonin cofactor prefoldin
MHMKDELHNGDEHDDVLKTVGQLPQSIEPQRDLWPDIESRLDAPKTARRRPGLQMGWTLALAAGVGCMALGALLTIGLMKRADTTAPLTAQATNPAATPVAGAPQVRQASLGGYAMLGPEYEQARATLMIGLAERLDRLPPVERQKVERNLNEIRRALGEINAALQLAPNDTLLRELLLNTYHSELTLLANVNQIADTIPSRTQS